MTFATSSYCMGRVTEILLILQEYLQCYMLFATLFLLRLQKPPQALPASQRLAICFLLAPKLYLAHRINQEYITPAWIIVGKRTLLMEFDHLNEIHCGPSTSHLTSIDYCQAHRYYLAYVSYCYGVLRTKNSFAWCTSAAGE